MSAKNITSEKMDTSGFHTGGYNGGPGAGKTTPKSAIIDAGEENSGSEKEVVGKGKESKNTKDYEG